MKINPDKADRLYSAMVRLISAPDSEYRRWSFIYAITEVHVTRYIIDSGLGPFAWFINDTRPRVEGNNLSDQQEQLVIQVNHAITEIVRPRPAKVIRPIRVVTATTEPVAIPVLQVPTPETVAVQLRSRT